MPEEEGAPDEVAIAVEGEDEAEAGAEEQAEEQPEEAGAEADATDENKGQKKVGSGKYIFDSEQVKEVQDDIDTADAKIRSRLKEKPSTLGRGTTLANLEKATDENKFAQVVATAFGEDTGIGKHLNEQLANRESQQGAFAVLQGSGQGRSMGRPASPVTPLVQRVYSLGHMFDEEDSPLAKCVRERIAYLPTRMEFMDPDFDWFKSRWTSANRVEVEPLLSWEDLIKLRWRHMKKNVDMYWQVYSTAMAVTVWGTTLHVVDKGFMGGAPIAKDFFLERMQLPPQMFGIFSGVISFLLVIRVNLSYGRWWMARQELEKFATQFYMFAITLCCWDQFTVTSGKDHYLFRRRVCGLISLMHAKCCEELRESYESPSLGDWYLEDSVQRTMNDHSLVQEIIGVNNDSEPVRDKTAQVYAWLVMLVSGRFFKCHFVPPPLLTQMFALIQNGMQSFHSALVIRNTEFPEPFTVIVVNLSTLMGFLIPVVIHPLLDFLLWKFLLLTIAMYGFVVTGLVAQMLEDPFGTDTFDHPLDQYQIDFDIALMEVIDKFDYRVPFATENGLREDDYKKAMAETIRWNNCAPKAPRERVGPTQGALRIIRRVDATKDGWDSDDSCIPFEHELKPRRRPKLVEDKAERVKERFRLKEELKEAAKFARMKRAVFNIEAYAIIHMNEKYGRHEFGKQRSKRVGGDDNAKSPDDNMAPLVSERPSRPSTFRQMPVDDSPANPGRTRAAKSIYRPDRGG
ncbi:unnamed protein product [Amoebophrya sp. A120]|nr:unnamed protein product [Amoebophrya sp. A120]|eukprot:GSA120T00001857001.1